MIYKSGNFLDQQQLDLLFEFFFVSCFCLFKANLLGAPDAAEVSAPVILCGLYNIRINNRLQYSAVVLEQRLF